MAKAKRKIDLPDLLSPEDYEEACAHAQRLEGVRALIARAELGGTDCSDCKASLEYFQNRIRQVCNAHFPDRQNPVAGPEMGE